MTHRPTGRELSDRLKASRPSSPLKSKRPPPDPITFSGPVCRRMTVTIPDSMASRITSRASLLGVTPQALTRALLRHYVDNPELYGCSIDHDHRPVLHSQAVLWNELLCHD